MKKVYALLCVFGLVLPYCFFVPFVVSHGLNMPLFMSQLFANHIWLREIEIGKEKFT